MFNEIKSILNDTETIKAIKIRQKTPPPTSIIPNQETNHEKNSFLSQDISFAEHQKKRKHRMGSRTKRQCPCLMKRCTEQARM